jgi:hypothetical protein
MLRKGEYAIHVHARTPGFERTVLDGICGATTWCGWGVLAHNSVKISALCEEKKNEPTSVRQKQPPANRADTGPPTGRSPTNRCTG